MLNTFHQFRAASRNYSSGTPRDGGYKWIGREERKSIGIKQSLQSGSYVGLRFSNESPSLKEVTTIKESKASSADIKLQQCC